ncbi:MAG TPA: patatin-like phospholipase family protein [Jatrophihabitans sp.]|jgi:NTE family protein|uniref:patatin-like phospholipase family protein n=1 Tax=Jatrophihabitans sp. TaxID=1932789 RepID=UPI002DFED8F9|nr:patatin-like phospholipase family protein [Jatrophihabitans sp.]
MTRSRDDGSVIDDGSPRAGRVAFVFQGGGSLSAPQVGMLRALTEVGIEPDLVIGTSAGALNAVAFASDPTPAGLDRLEELWHSLRRRHVAGISSRTLARALVGRVDGLFDPAPLAQLLGADMVPADLAATAIPAHVVATELVTGEPVVMSDGDTASALLASAAFPGIYPPVRRAGLRLVDGGVAADIPILQAEALGATTSYVLPAAVADDRGAQLRGPLAMAYHALGQILDSTARRDALAAAGEVHLLPAATSPATNPLDFRETRRLIRDGYELACSWLATQGDGSRRPTFA